MQAQQAAIIIKNYLLKLPKNDSKIISSPLNRAKETSEIINKHNNNLSIVFCDNLKERYYGDHSKTEVLDQEPLDNFYKRINGVIMNILQKYNCNPIIVSHHEVFKAFQKILVKNITPERISTGEIVVFWYKNLKWHLDRIDNFSLKYLDNDD